MTPYSQQELAQDWEFKILRSPWGAFRKSEFLQQCLADEAQAGWTLVEKFDDTRIRLKRPAAARERDGKLTHFDPYRTNVGISQNAVALTAIAISLGVAGIFLAIALLAHIH